VHGAASAHSAHSHFASTVSGVFYARVPRGSGRIRFHDPRGEHKVLRDVYGKRAPPKYARDITGDMPPLAPFHSPYAVEVESGLLVLFPSWLVHEVEDNSAMDSDGGYRISFAFNLAGDWHDTSGLILDVVNQSGTRETVAATPAARASSDL